MVKVKVTKKNMVVVSFMYSIFVFIPITILIMLFFGMDTLDLWYLDIGLYLLSFLIAYLWLLTRTIIYNQKVIKISPSKLKFKKVQIKISNLISVTENIVDYYGFPTHLITFETRDSRKVQVRANFYDFNDRMRMYINLKSINPNIKLSDKFSE